MEELTIEQLQFMRESEDHVELKKVKEVASLLLFYFAKALL